MSRETNADKFSGAGRHKWGRDLLFLLLSVWPLWLSFPISEAVAQSAPTIAFFTPTGGPAGTEVTVVGEHFDNGGNFDIVVTLNNVPCEIARITGKELVFKVPAGALTGPIKLTHGAGSAASSADFIVSPLTVTLAPPLSNILLGASRQLVATVSGSTNQSISWSVNGVVGGNSTVGTITQANPAVYQAPTGMPASSDLLVSVSLAANPLVKAFSRIQLMDPAGGIPNIDPPLSDPADFTGSAEIGLSVSRTRILLLLKSGTTMASIVPALGAVNAQVIGGSPEFGILAVSVPDAGNLNSVQAAINSLSSHAMVEAVDHDTTLDLQSLPISPPDTDTIYIKNKNSAGNFSYYAGDTNARWSWEVAPAGDNWGLEYANFPQAWNLFRYIDKLHQVASRTINVGVADTAVKYDHQDLSGIVTRLAGGKQQSGAHGTHVSGTIGANWADGRGICGASPFVRILNQPYGKVSTEAYWAGSAGDNLLIEMRRLKDQAGNLRVINFSQGYNFFDNSMDKSLQGLATGWKWNFDALGNATGLVDVPGLPEFNPRQSRLVANHGKMALSIAKWLIDPRSGHNAIIVAAAGNDRNDLPALVAAWGIADNSGGPGTSAYQRMLEWNQNSAEFNSPFCWAAYNGATNIVVVEALARKSDRREIERADFSSIARPAPRHPAWNYGFSAPGVDILSSSIVETSQPYPADGTLKTYEKMNGTSMAAPHVTGLIAYLCALDPDLSVPQLIQILRDSSRFYGAGGAVAGPPAIDAFKAVLAVDELNATNPDKRKWIQKALVNIDDGSIDGNDRQTDADEHGGGLRPPEMRINMSDFRRFRDAYLQISGRDAYFDGPADSLKRDLNGDEKLKDATGENMYPRCDFNGDGILSVDDLEVMADPDLWNDDFISDAGMDAAALLTRLEGLLSSGDIKLDADAIFAGDPEIDEVKVWAAVDIEPGKIEIFKTTIGILDVDGDAGDKRKVITLPADKEARIWASAFSGGEFKYFVLSPEAPAALKPGESDPKKRSIREGEDKTITFKKVGVAMVSAIELKYEEKAVVNVALEFEDGTQVAVDPFYKVDFALPVEAGTVAYSATDGYVLSSADSPGKFSLRAVVKTQYDEPVNAADTPEAQAELQIRTAVVNSPGGLALDSLGNMYVSDSEKGTVTFIPPESKGVVILEGLVSPGDVETDALGRSLIVAEGNGKVSRHFFGLTGTVTNVNEVLLVGAGVYLDTPSGSMPGHGMGVNRYRTNKNGTFNVLGLLAPTMGLDPVKVVVTIEYEGQSQAFPVTLKPIGQSTEKFVFNP